MQTTITKGITERGQAGAKLLATLSFPNWDLFATAANKLWNRTVKFPALQTSFFGYPIPYEWVGGTEPGKKDGLFPPSKAGISFKSLTQQIFNQCYLVNPVYRARTLTHIRGLLVSHSAFANTALDTMVRPRPAIGRLVQTAQTIDQLYVNLAVLPNSGNDAGRSINHLPPKHQSHSFHSLSLTAIPRTLIQTCLDITERVVQVLTMTDSYRGFVRRLFQTQVNQGVKSTIGNTATFVMQKLQSGDALAFLQKNAGEARLSRQTLRQVTLNESTAESLQRLSVKPDMTNANQQQALDQPIQQLIRSLTQHHHTQQQNQQYKQVLETIQRQLDEASQYNYRELQNLQQSIQQLKTMLGQKQNMATAPRVKAPTFYRPL